MPFAGDAAGAHAAATALTELNRRAGDELILVDNSGVEVDVPGVTVVHATGEHSPAHARNVGAEHAHNGWLLFLDADCRPVQELLDEYFSEPIANDVGAVAGEVVAATEGLTPAGGMTLAERYGARKSFLSQEAHLAHPYRPRAVAANLLVRRAAFEQLAGFYEGVRAGEDTDFSWRLQDAGWKLALQPRARAEHRYRRSVSELRRQWRGYAAGRAWLSRRYGDFEPEPAATRGLRRLARGGRRSRGSASPGPVRGGSRGPGSPGPVRGGSRGPRSPAPVRPLDRGRFLALDAVLAGEELRGFLLSNRPQRDEAAPAQVVLVAERFPTSGDPLTDLAKTLQGARVEAAARPNAVDARLGRALRVDYREDDGIGVRAAAVARLVVRHPVRAALDLARRVDGEPPLSAIAPAVRRLERDSGARVLALGGEAAQVTARRLAALAGRSLEPPRQ
jgi:hypothetical protein